MVDFHFNMPFMDKNSGIDLDIMYIQDRKSCANFTTPGLTVT